MPNRDGPPTDSQSERSFQSSFGCVQLCNEWLIHRTRFEFHYTLHRTTAAIMGQPKQRRADRPKKRGWHGNQHTGSSKKQKIRENESVSVPDSVDNSETADNNTRASHRPNRACDVKVSASSVKLNQGNSDVLFDKDVSLIGFRFVDLELLIQFVQKLLCPECKRPLGENQRLSRVAEQRTNQASKVVFICQCQHSVDFFTSKKCGKVYESNRRFPLAIFSLGKDHSGAKRFLGNMNIPPPPHKKSWQNHKKQILKSTQTVAAECTPQAVAEVKTAKGSDVVVSVDDTWHSVVSAARMVW